MSLTDSIAQAIAQEEGFNIPGTRPNRNNNPGDMWDGLTTGKTHRIWPQYPIDSGGFLILPDVTTGWNLLYGQINLNISRGLTLVEFFAGKPGVYAGFAPGGSGGNDPQSYAAFVAGQVGIDPNTPLNALGSTAAPSIDPTTGLPAIDPTTGLPPDTSPAGSIDWATIGLVGLGALVLFYIFNSLSD